MFAFIFAFAMAAAPDVVNGRLSAPHAPAHAVSAAAKPAAKTASKTTSKPASTVAAAAFVWPDPLGPVADGKMQCYVPDTTKKTCNSLAAYKQNKDGTISNIAHVLVNGAPVVVLKTVSPVRVEDGAVCGPITEDSIEKGTLTVAGTVQTADEAAPLLARIAAGMAPFMNQDICTRYTDKDGTMMSSATLGGVAKPEMNQPVIWVSPEDGYNVAP